MGWAGDGDARRRRALRGTASAAVATTLAATAHTISGGLAPLWLIVATTLLVTPAAVWLVGRAPSVWRTTAVVLASQGLFHTFFSIAGSADLGAAAVHLHSAAPAAFGSATPHVHVAGASMSATHVIAAALTVAVLVSGERLIGIVARGMRRLERMLSPIVPPPALIRSAPSRHRRFTPARRVRSSLSLRGPPVTTA
ncbi:hypothetical protein [Microbacterium oleivorans]|uniref:Uncharacterized protein n=1 Tax=Microbacterium oleivorans TaxID=273677 RepID=A0A7D5JCN6_9MICO|nr:hypothetical protein [Microbacterium oleivorans]QLD11060.1 hypothetical protein HW566_04220 [Microbacterium oleivorans]